MDIYGLVSVVFFVSLFFSFYIVGAKGSIRGILKKGFGFRVYGKR